MSLSESEPAVAAGRDGGDRRRMRGRWWLLLGFLYGWSTRGLVETARREAQWREVRRTAQRIVDQIKKGAR